MQSMKLIKKQSKQTYKNPKTGKEGHYYNYFLQLDNGKRIQVKPAFKDDIKAFDTICEFER